MRKLFFGVLILSAVTGYTQGYKLTYDINFPEAHSYMPCPIPPEMYKCNVYYNTLYNNAMRGLINVTFFTPPGSFNAKGVALIDIKDGPIKTIWLDSDADYPARSGIAPCRMRWDTLYKNSDDSLTVNSTFNLANVRGPTTWGCLDGCRSRPVYVKVFNLIPSLSIELIDKESILPIDDKITLEATAGFPRNLYKWQYGITDPRLGTETWKDLQLPFKGDSVIQMSAKDILGDSAEYAVGKNIFFRIDMGNNFYSNKITLNLQQSAPHITKVDNIPPKCFGENTGSAKIYFDRALKPTELLNILIVDATDTTKLITNKLNITALEPGNMITLDSKLAPRKYKIELTGKYRDTLNTYTSGSRHQAFFEIKSPSAVSFTTTPNNVRCHNGKDGAIKITATGGVGNYKVGYKKSTDTGYIWQNFSTATTHTITGLDTGKYNIMVRDANDCFEKDMMNREMVRTETINQPAEAVKIDNAAVKDALGYGRTDGKIEVIVKGGTPKTGGSYNITWKKLDGTVLSSVTNTTVATGYQTILQNIGKGKYILNVTDSNFSIAASGATQGCVLIDTFNVNEPPPITINIEKDKYISCKGDAHGAIVAHVSGGIPLTTGIAPYTYKWFRREATDIDITQTDSVATNLKAGQYVVKIIDQNGVEKISDLFTLTEPDNLSLQFTIQANSCQGDGSITAIATGGTTPYHFEWTTRDTTATINNQKEGDYYATITDAHGCVIGSSVHLAIPQGIKIDNAITQTPSYYNSQDGAIQLTISGGNPPYTYRWGNGATTKDLQNITAGTYPITITDASGCTQTQTYTLQNPIRIIQTDGAPLANGVTTKTLCNGQHIDIDATIPDNAAVYNWRSNNSFSANTAKVTLTNAGKYWVTITDSKGITASDTLIIKQNNTDIDASFVVSTQAFKGEKVTFVNISYPAPERISWLIPNNPKIETIQNNQNVAELIFKDTGTYTISMKAFMGGCEKMITKKVIVIEGQQFDDIGAVQNPYIKEFTLAPNPNTGQFNVKIVLQEQGKIRVRMMNVSNSAVVNNKELSGSSQYTIPYNITLAPGVYILLLETAKGNQMLKIIIN